MEETEELLRCIRHNCAEMADCIVQSQCAVTGLLVAFVLKDGTLIFHFPNIGLIIQKENAIKTYTLAQIQQGKLKLESDILDLISNIQSGTVLQPIPEHVLSENGFPLTMAGKLVEGIKHHPTVLIEAATKNNVTHASATSNQ